MTRIAFFAQQCYWAKEHAQRHARVTFLSVAFIMEL